MHRFLEHFGEFDTNKLDEALEEAENEVTDENVAVKKAEAELESAKIDAESNQYHK